MFSEELKPRQNLGNITVKNSIIFVKEFVCRVVIIAILVTTIIFPVSVIGAINPEINYQAKLTDEDGIAVADGSYSITFKLYTVPTNGTALWTETNTVSATSGLLSVLLGQNTALTSTDFNQTLYLGIEVAADGEMTPRKKLGSVPSAFNSDKLDGLDSTDLIRASTTTLPNVYSLPGAGQIGSSSASTTMMGNLETIGNAIVRGFLTAYTSITAPYFTATSTTAVNTFPNYIANNGTTTNATSTELYVSGSASTTALRANSANIGTLTNAEVQLNTASRHSAVTLSGALDYITLVGQDIVRGAIDLATDITGTLGIANGGTGQTSFGQGWLHSDGSTLTSSTSPTVNYLTATSTSATSTFAGGLTIETSGLVYDFSTNNVGIGTASPSEKFHVYGSGGIIRGLIESADSNSAQLKLKNSEGEFSMITDDGEWRLYDNTDATYRIYIDTNGRVGVGTTTPTAQFSASSTSYVTAIFDQRGTSDILQLQDSGSSVLVVKDGGNVGIGTTTPFSKFSAEGTSGAGVSVATIKSTTAGGELLYLRGETGDSVFEFDSAGTGGEALMKMYEDGVLINQISADASTVTYFNGSNVGIGSTTPYAKLSVTNNTSNPSFIVEDATSPDSSQFIIDASGNVGIGTSTPSELLHLKTNETGAGSALIRLDNGGTVANEVGLEFYTSLVSGTDLASYRAGRIYSAHDSTSYTGARLSFQSMTTGNTLVDTMHLKNGNVGIGTTTPYAKLSVAGPVVAEYFVATSTSATSTFAGGLTIETSGLVYNYSTNYVGIGTASPSVPLDVTGATNISGNLTVATDSLFVDSAQNHIGVGIADPELGSGSSGGHFYSDGSIAELRLTAFRASTPRTVIRGQGAAGSAGTPTTATAGTEFLSVRGEGYGTTAFFRSSEIFFLGGTGSFSDTSMPGRITLRTAPDGTIVPTEKMRIDSAEIVINEDSADHDFRIESNGNANMFVVDGGTDMVGIGVLAPSATLDLVGNGEITGYWEYLSATSPATGVEAVWSPSGTGAMTMQAGSNVTLQADEDASGTGAVILRTAATDRLTIANGGNVGIGSTTPYSKLAITNTTVFPSFIVEDSTSPDATHFVIDAGGDVGIGTSTPFARLAITNTSSDHSFIIEDSASPDATPFVIDAGGLVGIGTTSPFANLSVNADVGQTSFAVGSTSQTSFKIDPNGRVVMGPSHTVHASSTISLANSINAGVNIQFNDLSNSGSWYIGTYQGEFGIGNSATVGVKGAATDRKFTVDTSGRLYVGSLDVSQTTAVCYESNGTNKIELTNCNGTPADLAEWYETDGSASEGDIVMLTEDIFEYKGSDSNPFTGAVVDQVKDRSISMLAKAEDPALIFGVVSADPYQVLGEDVKNQAEHPLPVALVGRVPVKVNLENGVIKPGDHITLSSSAGIGRKANQGEAIIGIAISSFNQSSRKNNRGVGEVMVMINLRPANSNLSPLLVDGEVEADNLWSYDSGRGVIVAQASLDLNNLDLQNVRAIQSASGNWQISEGGTFTAKKVSTDELQVENGITIRDQATGEYYCLSIINGEMETVEGSCGETQPQPQADPQPEVDSADSEEENDDSNSQPQADPSVSDEADSPMGEDSSEPATETEAGGENEDPQPETGPPLEETAEPEPEDDPAS